MLRRDTILTTLHDVPFKSVILKYSPLFEGTIQHTIVSAEHIKFITRTHDDLIVVCNGCSIDIYNANTHLFKLRSEERYINSIERIAICTDNRIAVAYADLKIKLWNPYTGNCEVISNYMNKSIHLISFNDKIINVAEHLVEVYDPKNNCIDSTFDIYGCTCVCLNDNIIICGLNDGRIMTSQMKELHGHTMKINCVLYIKNRIISGSQDTTLKVWDDEKCIYTLQNHSAINCLLFKDDKLIAGCNDGCIRIWKEQDNIQTLLPGTHSFVRHIDTLLDGRFITFSNHGMIKVWNTSTKYNEKEDTSEMRPADNNCDRILYTYDNTGSICVLTDGRVVAARIHGYTFRNIGIDILI